MKDVSHRGISCTNTVSNIVNAFEHFSIVEIDVCFNKQNEIILCQKTDTQELLKSLLSLTTSMSFIVTIKAAGIKQSIMLAKALFCMVQMYNQHIYKLCSCNEYCVVELIELKQLLENTSQIQIGAISHGVPLGVFQHLPEIEFAILHYYILDEEILDKLKYGKKDVYIWIHHDKERIKLVKRNLLVDGLIYDIKI